MLEYPVYILFYLIINYKIYRHSFNRLKFANCSLPPTKKKKSIIHCVISLPCSNVHASEQVTFIHSRSILSLQVGVARSDGLRILTQGPTELVHNHLEQHKQGPLVQAPHRHQRPRFLLLGLTLIVGHGLRRDVRNRGGVPHARAGLRLRGQEQDPGAVGLRHLADRVDGREPAGTSGCDEEIGGGDGRGGHVEDEVGGEAQVGQAHAECPQHEALAAHTIKEDPGFPGGGGRQLGNKDVQGGPVGSGGLGED